MKIAIDIGNSNSKICCNRQQVHIVNNQELSRPDFVLPAAVGLPDRLEPVVFSISSVVTEQMTSWLISQLQRAFVVERPAVVKVWRSAEILQRSGIRNAAEIAHFGSDRALKIYAMSRLSGISAKMSIGCGSAFTIEVIQNNQLVASLILPGLSMQLNSLAMNTAKLPQLKPEQLMSILASNPVFSTAASIVNGVLQSYVGLIQQLLKQYQPEEVLCSGGYSALIVDSLRDLVINLRLRPYLEVETLSDLILEGDCC